MRFSLNGDTVFAPHSGALRVNSETAAGSQEVECCCAQSRAARRVALSELRPGEVGVVADAALGEADAAFLRAMGLCNDARIRLCRAGEPCIVAVGSFGGECGCGSMCRIGLARRLAEKIYVNVQA